ncbi:hypothetical protein N7G274_008543 [Stereocaulon virgatum]|uniref:Uncharacterized protein n=1 Tax=Stereocaulon virgatum TaxID=373712 RepID=A0ABR3ZZZ0_9LECA
MDRYSSSQQRVSVPISQFTLHDHDHLPSKPPIPNQRINPTDPHAPYYASLARQPLIRRTVSNVLWMYDNIIDLPKETRFELFCKSKQAIHDEKTILDEWERERALEESVIGEFYDSSTGNFSQWVKNHDQMEMEFKISRNKAIEAYWTEQSRVLMQDHVKAECYKVRVQEQADAQIRSKQEKEAARFREKKLSDTSTRKEFKESVQERARAILQAQKNRVIKSTSNTSLTGSKDTATTVSTRSAEEIRQELRDKVHARAELLNMVKPQSPKPPSSSSRHSSNSNYAVFTPPTSTPVSPSPRKTSFSPTAQEFATSIPERSLSPTSPQFASLLCIVTLATAPPIECSDPTILVITTPLPHPSPLSTPCWLSYCRKRVAPGTIISPDQAWLRVISTFHNIALRLRDLHRTAPHPFIKPGGQTDSMEEKRSRAEELVWLRGYDKELRKQLLHWDASELESYEEFLYAQIESREQELQMERMGRAN